MIKDGKAYILKSSNDLVPFKQLVAEPVPAKDDEVLIEINNKTENFGWQRSDWVHVSLADLKELVESLEKHKLRSKA